jgi:hypothetical protein
MNPVEEKDFKIKKDLKDEYEGIVDKGRAVGDGPLPVKQCFNH